MRSHPSNRLGWLLSFSLRQHLSAAPLIPFVAPSCTFYAVFLHLPHVLLAPFTPPFHTFCYAPSCLLSAQKRANAHRTTTAAHILQRPSHNTYGGRRTRVRRPPYTRSHAITVQHLHRQPSDSIAQSHSPTPKIITRQDNNTHGPHRQTFPQNGILPCKISPHIKKEMTSGTPHAQGICLPYNGSD